MNTTKPSPQAMRAAEKIFPNAVAGQIRNTAELIDAELSTPDLEQRAQAAAEEIHPQYSKSWLAIQIPSDANVAKHQDAEMIRVQLKQTIASHFAGLGGSEELREHELDHIPKSHVGGTAKEAFDRLFSYLAYVSPNARRSDVDPYQVGAVASYSFEDLRRIADEVKALAHAPESGDRERLVLYKRFTEAWLGGMHDRELHPLWHKDIKPKLQAIDAAMRQSAERRK